MNRLRPPVAESQLFRALFETAPDAMIVAGDSGRILLANPQAELLFGYAQGGMIGLSVEVLLPASLRAVHELHRARYMASPRVRKMGEGYELTGVRSDGQPFPVEIALSPIPTHEGTLFAASIRDISATRRARQAIARARYDIFVAQAGRLVLEAPNYEVAIDALPSLLSAALEAEAVAIVFIHRGTAELTMRAATGMSTELQHRLIQAFSSDGLGKRLALRNEAVLTLGRSMESDFVGLRQALVDTPFHDAILVPLFDRFEPMGMLMALAGADDAFGYDKLHFLQSVANMLAATVQRSRSEEQLAHAQRLDALGQLTGGIAHDFNNLLTVISGNLQMLESSVTEAPGSADIIASALRAVDRCTSLTRKLLGFARRRRLVPVALDPAKALAGLADMLGRTLGARIELSFHCPDGVPAVYADPGELDAALVNLALNARDAMPDGGDLKVGVHERALPSGIEELGLAPGNYVVFEVADSGVGMTREVMSRALEPFFTTKEAGKGSGMGLSMVYGFVRQSGGQLIIDSKPGGGTRVEMLLPVASELVIDPAEAASATTVDFAATVLVVEDEPDVRRLAAAFLRMLGYVAHVAGDAAEALEMLAEHPDVDLLFCDVVMGGGMTGVQLADEARRLYPGLAVLLTSGYSQDVMDVTDRRLPLLRKPYRRDELALAVRQVLDKRKRGKSAKKESAD